MSHEIDYGSLMHNAMRSLIQQVLTDVSENGLPGAHHFFITFDTQHPEAKLADWLRERYPEEMTVVMQHWFDGLEVNDDGFAITLNFGEAPEPLYIPYDAIQTFVDPSVEFGLRFEASEDDEEQDHDDDFLHSVDNAVDDDSDESIRSDVDGEDVPEAPMDEGVEPPVHEAEVVSLDQFRK